MRIALYARVSTEEQSLHGLSIEAQLAALRSWAEGQTVVGEYVDAGISGRIPIKKRPQLQRLLRDIEAGAVDLVAFTKLDRWTRNIREYYKAQDVLDAHRVAWRAIHEDYETETASGRLKVNIMLSIAQDEADRTSERVKAVFVEKRRKGLCVNGHMPPGLDYRDGLLVPNADAEKVRELFRLYLATRNANEVARRTGEIFGTAYSRRGARQLLANEKYLSAGVVPAELWERVQAVLAQRQTRHVRSDRVYLFSGLLFCPVCGYRLAVHSSVLESGTYVYYRCDRHDRVHRCSWGGSVKEEELERYLLRHIVSAVEKHNIRVTRKASKPVDAAALQRKLDRLTDLYVDEKISKDDYDRRSAPIRDALKAASLPHHTVDTAIVRSSLDTYAGLSKSARKAFWSALVSRIVPSGDGFSVDLILP